MKKSKKKHTKNTHSKKKQSHKKNTKSVKKKHSSKQMSKHNKPKKKSKKKSHNNTKKINKSKGKKKKSKLNSLIVDITIGIFSSLVIFLLLGSFFLSIDLSKDNSMYPQIKNGDRIWVEKKLKKINRFDIIAIRNGKKIEFRRVIGLPEERVKYTDDYLYIDDQLVDEKFLIEKINDYGKKGQVYTQSAQEENGFQIDEIPKNSYLVLGDNRPNATDSRQYGLIEKNKIKGKAVYLAFPLRLIDD